MINTDKLKPIVKAAQSWRRQIHAHPETAFEEVKTSAFVADKLRSFGLEVSTGLAETGVVATLNRGSGRRIALRADMDALHIHEKNEFDHRSTIDGKMHACGHDGHTAMLLAAAEYLSQENDLHGTLHFIFQPAEENEGGGRAMVEQGLFNQHPADEVYGMHNWPGLEAGAFAARVGPQMAAFDLFEIEIAGKGAHAAMPQQGSDSIVAASSIISMLQTIVSRAIDPVDTAVVSVTQVHGGDTWNILPENVVLRGCARYFKPGVQDVIKDRMQRICKHAAAAHGVTAKVNYEARYPAVINTETETGYSLDAARMVADEGHVHDTLPPAMASEDFSYMLREKPGCYVWIGNGKGAASASLHNPHYDFNDNILENGARYWITLAKNRLNKAA